MLLRQQQLSLTAQKKARANSTLSFFELKQNCENLRMYEYNTSFAVIFGNNAFTDSITASHLFSVLREYGGFVSFHFIIFSERNNSTQLYYRNKMNLLGIIINVVDQNLCSGYVCVSGTSGARVSQDNGAERRAERGAAPPAPRQVVAVLLQ